ncbi:MAG: hypothetical protein JOY90_01725 [Bradyrhizobium sp.]|nr:hypothetical protein [Bradyrhizobium sp.]MBV9559173.1 hypothetical protein [Bradyrhizobium sp.]
MPIIVSTILLHGGHTSDFALRAKAESFERFREVDTGSREKNASKQRS